MGGKLIEKYEISLHSPDCSPGEGWYGALVKVENDISEVLPYLNAELKGDDYYHEQKILICKNEDIKYAFRQGEIAIAPIENMEEAKKAAEKIISTVNDIWARRDEIEPDFKGAPPLPELLEIFKLLPRTNCRECGSPSCMAFATALRTDSSKLSLCPYISEKDYQNLTSC